MEIGFIGLGRMGANLAKQLLEKGHRVKGYDVDQSVYNDIIGLQGQSTVESLIASLETPRLVWLMVPSSHTEAVFEDTLQHVEAGDIIVDGGNSYYKDSVARGKQAGQLGVHFVDVGVSGGVSGARHGASMMIGGDSDPVKRIEPILRDACVENGYGHVGPTGAGHLVKGLHNAIEYGMMSALAEGFAAMQEAPMQIDTSEAIKAYNHGSIITGNLTNWLEEAHTSGMLGRVSGTTPKGETEDEMEALAKQYTLPITEAAIAMRRTTRSKPGYEGKIISALRNLFGGHKLEPDN